MTSAATLSVSHAPTISKDNTSDALSQSKKNYLERCVEAFSPENESTLRTQERLWNVAAVATIVAFSVLAAGAFLAASIAFPIYLPVVAIGLLCLMGPVHQLYKKFKENADEAGALAQQAIDIRKEYESLPESKFEIMQTLYKLGVPLYKIDDEAIRADVTKLKPVIAYYNYWKKQADELKEQCKETYDEAVKYAIMHPDDTKTIQELRNDAMALERNALIAKTNAAFMYGILKHPQFSASFFDFAKFNLMSQGERVVAHKFQDPKADVFIQFNNPSAEPIRLADMFAEDAGAIERLSDRIFSAAKV
jgi:hypothetical protein